MQSIYDYQKYVHDQKEQVYSDLCLYNKKQSDKKIVKGFE